MLALNAGNDTVGSTHQLICKQQNGLETELPVAEVEEVLQTRTKQVEDHGVVVALGAEPANKGHADAAGERLVHLGLILELRVLRLDGLELDGDFLTRDDVDPKVDVTYGIYESVNAPHQATNQATHQRNPSQSSCPTCTCHRHGGRGGAMRSRPSIFRSEVVGF